MVDDSDQVFNYSRLNPSASHPDDSASIMQINLLFLTFLIIQAFAIHAEANNTTESTVFQDTLDYSGESVIVHNSCTSVQRSSKDVMTVIAKNIQSIEKQYDKRYRQDTSLAGNIAFNIKINSSGIVDTVVILDCSIVDDDFVAYILKTVREWQFPPLSSSFSDCQTKVTYAKCFSKAGEKQEMETHERNTNRIGIIVSTIASITLLVCSCLFGFGIFRRL